MCDDSIPPMLANIIAAIGGRSIAAMCGNSTAAIVNYAIAAMCDLL